MFHKAFSKVNLVLKIFKKDIDHKKHKVDAVTMIYKKIYDKIKINKSTNFSVIYLNQAKQKINIENCSITRTINWLKKTFNQINLNYKITVIKNIPIGSGLGGESSDAGYVLYYILKKNRIVLNQIQLKSLAIDVGSDIPFFYKRYIIAHVSNYGDVVTPIKIPQAFIDVYLTNINCSTQKVFYALDNDKKYESHVNTKELYEKLKDGQFDNNLIYNDLQQYVFENYSKILDDYRKLNRNNTNNIIVNGAGSSLLILKF